MKCLDKTFYERDTLIVAQELLGKYLVRQYNGEYIVGRIVEAEAYIGAIDKACHAYGGKQTKRTQTLYASGGTCYVYLIYGMYYCANIVTEPENVAAAILLRGVEIIEGQELASKLRYKKEWTELNKTQRKNLANGPGKLCNALALTKADNNNSFMRADLFITDEWKDHEPKAFEVITGPRIGIGYAEEAVDFPWRFCLKESGI
jgi:DNA-3-methyladenine glycosylase (3mg)